MKNSVIVVIIGLLLGAGCAGHVESTQSTFSHINHMLVLNVQRHMDEVMNGPDSEEDQTLILQLRDYQIGERIEVPSAKAAVHFDVDRSGPVSEGDEYTGYVTVLQEGDKKIKAHLDLVVTAHTGDRRYMQTEKFKGDYDFYKASQLVRPIE